MANKKPLCLYGGNVKQLQPGDALVGAYNATEAGWVVNASGWLVATPGTAKMWNQTVTGSILPAKSDGIKLMDRNGAVIFRTASNDGIGVAVGSAQDPAAGYNLHVQEKGSGGVLIAFTNDTTSHAGSDGFAVGINSAEQAEIYNKENTDLLFYTNNLQRWALKNDGSASLNGNVTMGADAQVNASLFVNGNASVNGNMSVGGTGAFGNTVLITADVQVAAGQKFFMDGGLDTYWTASQDIITGHVDSATAIRIQASAVHLTANASVDGSLYLIGNASVNGNLAVGGDFHVLGTMVVSATTNYLGDNILGNAPTDSQILHGVITASGPVEMVGNASIGGNLVVQPTTGTPLIVRGNASIDGTLNIGSTLRVYGTGVFNKAVTVSSEVRIDPGKRLYFDGSGGDTYITATTNDSLDLVVGNVQMMNWQNDYGVVIGSAVASAVGVDLHVAVKDAEAYIRLTNANTGHTSNDGVLIGPNGTTETYLITYDSPWNIYANGVHVATWADSGLTIANGDKITVNTIISRDSGGLYLYEDGSAGIHITDSGPIHMTLAASLDSTLDVLDTITGDAAVIGSVLGLKAGARLRACTINASGVITDFVGDDMMLSSTDASPNNQQFIAEKVWNAVYNDVVDFQDLAEDGEWKYGKAYFDSYDGARICTERCQKSVIGICSDTFGFAVGKIQGRTQIPISVSGWALAFVDMEYDSGEPLTNSASGHLTAMTATEKREYPERMVAIYKRPESEDVWMDRVEVNGRHWVKVR